MTHYTNQDRYIQLLECWTMGLDNRVIANNLNLSIYTVREHARQLFKLLNVNTQAQAVYKYYVLNNQVLR